jgi:hypothetical protein
VAAGVAISVTTSYVQAMVRPSNVGLGVRSIEWLRDHGGAWLVSDIEGVYYSLTAPARGGPGLRALPKVGRSRASGLGRGQGIRAYRPRALAPVVHPGLSGEGIWHAATPRVSGAPPVLVTTFRPDPSYPRLVAGVAWIDRSRTRVVLYPGRYEPPVGLSRGPMEVPRWRRGNLAATFNGGFKLGDSNDGFVAFSHTFDPLRPGLATLVGYRDGAVDVVSWHGAARPGHDVVFARQNLPLIIDRGRLNQNLSDGPAWGATLGNAIQVWRSGVGVDRRGDLIYAAANDQTVRSLARILRHAGAVRAMELDINFDWVTFNSYGRWGARDASKLLPEMARDRTRYLTPDDRDFFAVYRHGMR